MKHLQNDRGAAFLMVLLITGFVSVFAVFLLGSAQTASQQASKTSGQLEARLVAEAGIDFFEVELLHATRSALDNELINVRLPGDMRHDLDDTHYFTIDGIRSSLNGTNLTIDYTVTGHTASEQISIEQQTVITP